LSDEEKVEGISLASLDSLALLQTFIGALASKAWVTMGLMPGTEGEVEADLEQARIAIDGVAALADVVERHTDDTKAKGELRDLVATLRMNYVTQSGRDVEKGEG